MNNQSKNLGFIKSPLDLRDIRLGKVQAPVAIPRIYFSDLSKEPVLYQGKQPACIGHATASGLMTLGDTQSKDFSPRFLYALCKKTDGLPEEEGTFYRQALKIAKSTGCCDNVQFPNDIDLDKEEYKRWDLISQEAYDVAQIRIIKAYASVNDLSFNGIKQAIFQNKVVLLGMKLGNEWWTAPDGEISWEEKDILPLRTPKQIISGHAILAYGYDENYIYFRNSFGKDWGREGEGFFSKDYLPYIQEGWTFVDLPDVVIQNLIKQKESFQKVVELFRKLINLFKRK